MTPTKNKNSKLRLLTLGLLGAFLMPASATATLPAEADLQCAMDECAESIVTIQVDTLTGDVYLVDNDTGALTLTDNEIPVYFGSQSRVLLNLQYTVGEWEVEISPQGGTSETFETVGGSLRYFIEADNGEYLFSSEEAQQGASTMASMAPVPPGDIILMPEPTCPPED